MTRKKKKRALRRMYGQSVEDRYGGQMQGDDSTVREAGDGARATKRRRKQTTLDEARRHEDDDGERELYDLALTSFEQFPADMRKYWIQRHWLFSLFDGSSTTGKVPLLDRESWYSVTPEPIAARIAQRCRSGTVLDAFCGVGGNTIQFALTCEHVIAIDVDPIKVRMAQYNARIYGVEAYVTFLQGDWRDFARDWIAFHQRREDDADDLNEQHIPSRWQDCESRGIDCVFLSPPWGGVDYRSATGVSSNVVQDHSFTPPLGSTSSSTALVERGFYPLSALAPSGGRDLFHLARQITQNICMFLPRTVELNELVDLAKSAGKAETETQEEDCLVDVEEHWLDGRCKALTCFFGDLRLWAEP